MGPILLRRLYGTTTASEFGPMALKAVRQHMIQLGWTRGSINNQIGRLKNVFRWAVEEELVPPAVLQALAAVRGLQRGRSDARETQPVRPVARHMIDAIEPFVSRPVWALIQLQLVTGARPSELLSLRSTDFDTSGDIWTVQPADHKTAWREHARVLYFGPRAQRVLAPFLADRPVGSMLFSPGEAAQEHRDRRTATRRTPLACGNRPGSNRKLRPARQPRNHYGVDSYRRAIQRACDAAFPPPEHLARQRVKARKGTCWETDRQWSERLGSEGWAQLRAWQREHRWHPHQLRHNAATHIRKEFGIDVARIILGQRSLDVTEVYAELDREQAEQAVRKIG